jgi:hypothetical protein
MELQKRLSFWETLAQAQAIDDGFEIVPTWPGEYFFDPMAEKGDYIHKVTK